MRFIGMGMQGSPVLCQANRSHALPLNNCHGIVKGPHHIVVQNMRLAGNLESFIPEPRIV